MCRTIAVIVEKLIVAGTVFAAVCVGWGGGAAWAAPATPVAFQVQGAANNCDGAEYTVPANRHAVIEAVSGEAQVGFGTNPFWILSTTVGGVTAYQVFAPTQPIFGTFVVSAQTLRYADADTSVRLVPFFSPGATVTSCNFISFSGHVQAP